MGPNGSAREEPNVPLLRLSALLFAAAFIAACDSNVEVTKPDARPVRTVTVDKRAPGTPVILTGRIEAEDEVSLGFRISGRLLDSGLEARRSRRSRGKWWHASKSQNELNALRAAQANLAAAQGQLTQARNHFDRQDTLLKQGWTTRANHDQATQARQTAQSQVDAAEAQLKAAHDLVELHRAQGRCARRRHGNRPARRRGRSGRTDDPQACPQGRPRCRLRRAGSTDSVRAERSRRSPSASTDDPSVIARGRIREVAPQANPVTRTFEVKVGLTDPPPAMRLGATVTGRMEREPSRRPSRFRRRR